jgi:CRP/FNR family transcriptional regulator, cyclic AMP receptor protein
MFGNTNSDARRMGQASSSAAPQLSKAEKKELVGELSRFDMFAGCSHDDLHALVESGRPFAVPPNWALMAETTPADSCYAIIRGNAAVYRGRERIAELGPGSVVGEMAVLTGTLRRATVTSSTRVSGLRVDNDALVALFGKRPSLLSALKAAFEARMAAPVTLPAN